MPKGNPHNMYPEEGQQARLRAGLSQMPQGFLAEECGVCEATGRRMQTFTSGCGGGYYRSNAMCSWCKGWGLIMGNDPAPESVINQVMEAANGNA